MPEFHESVRRIFLPTATLERMQIVADSQQGGSGVLLYRMMSKPGDSYDCHVHSLIIDKVGSVNPVGVSAGKSRVIEKFLANNPRYGIVNWHCAPHDDNGKARLTGQDVTTYERALARDPNFIGLKITPDGNILLHGHGTDNKNGTIKTTLEVSTPFKSYASDEAFVKRELERARKELKTSKVVFRSRAKIIETEVIKRKLGVKAGRKRIATFSRPVSPRRESIKLDNSSQPLIEKVTGMIDRILPKK